MRTLPGARVAQPLPAIGIGATDCCPRADQKAIQLKLQEDMRRLTSLLGGGVPTASLRPESYSTAGIKRTQPVGWVEGGALLATVLWGCNFVSVRVGIGYLPPVLFTSIRLVLAGVLLLGYLRLREGAGSLQRGEFGAFALVGLAIGLSQVFLTTALSLTSVAITALIIATIPVLVTAMSIVAGTDVPTIGKLTGTAIAFAGVTLVIGVDQHGLGGGTLFGGTLSFASALVSAVFLTFLAPVLRRNGSVRTTAWATLLSGFVTLPVGLGQLAAARQGSSLVAAVPTLLYSGVLSSGAASAMMYRAMQVMGPIRSMTYQFIVPLVAVLAAWLLLGQGIQFTQLVGGLVIVSGVILSRAEAPKAHV